MTAPIPSNADDLLSAYVDGLASPDLVELVESSPALMQRVDEMRAVIDQLGAVPPVDAAQRDRHIGAALGEFDRLLSNDDLTAPPSSTTTAEAEVAPASHAPAHGATSASANAGTTQAGVSTGASVTDIAAARSSRRPRRLNLVAAAAAVVALLFAGVVAFGVNRGSTTDVVDATSAIAATDASDDAADAAGEEDDAMADDAVDDVTSAAAMAAESSEDRLEFAGDDAGADGDGDAMEEDDDAMADEAMADEDDAVEEDAMEDDAMAEEQASAAPPADSVEEAGAAAESADAEADLVDDDLMARSAINEVPDLGAFGTADELSRAITARLDGLRPSRFATLITDPIAPACSELLPALDLASPSLIAHAVLRDRRVDVHASTTDSVIVVAIDDCSVAGELLP